MGRGLSCLRRPFHGSESAWPHQNTCRGCCQCRGGHLDGPPSKHCRVAPAAVWRVSLTVVLSEFPAGFHRCFTVPSHRLGNSEKTSGRFVLVPTRLRGTGEAPLLGRSGCGCSLLLMIVIVISIIILLSLLLSLLLLLLFLLLLLVVVVVALVVLYHE